MTTQVDFSTLQGLKEDVPDICTIEGSVATGLEHLAKEEVLSKLGTEAVVDRGHILMDLEISKVPEVLKLRSIDNVYVLSHAFDGMAFSKDDKDADIELFEALPNKFNWSKSLKVWKAIKGFDGTLGIDDEPKEAPTVKFRATCYRAGTHAFNSMEAARAFGGAINDVFHWGVDLTNFDLEVVLNISEKQVYVCLALTKESLHRRNITVFGPTTLRATICYGLISLAKVQAGDIVVDPMCGGGSIPIEGAIAFPEAFYMAGDIHEKAWKRTWENVNALNKNLNIDTFTWNVERLPLKNNSVDVFITDLPFGKRQGSKFTNKILYKKALAEMSRTAKVDTGRAVLLTQDKGNAMRMIHQFEKWWKMSRVVAVNIGGLASLILVLQRSSATM